MSVPLSLQTTSSRFFSSLQKIPKRTNVHLDVQLSSLQYWPVLSRPLLLSWRSHMFFPAKPSARNRWQLLLGIPGWRCKPSDLWTPTGCSAERTREFIHKHNQQINNTVIVTQISFRDRVAFVSFCVTDRPQTLQTYFHIVGVDVIWAHNIRISVLQDDPGFIDLWEKTSG